MWTCWASTISLSSTERALPSDRHLFTLNWKGAQGEWVLVCTKHHANYFPIRLKRNPSTHFAQIFWINFPVFQTSCYSIQYSHEHSNSYLCVLFRCWSFSVRNMFQMMVFTTYNMEVLRKLQTRPGTNHVCIGGCVCVYEYTYITKESLCSLGIGQILWMKIRRWSYSTKENMTSLFFLIYFCMYVCMYVFFMYFVCKSVCKLLAFI